MGNNLFRIYDQIPCYLIDRWLQQRATQITAGSADRMVYVWDVATTGVAYKLPGHAGSVNETCFHPTEPICMFISQ
jgi:WD40 repeat protein